MFASGVRHFVVVPTVLVTLFLEKKESEGFISPKHQKSCSLPHEPCLHTGTKLEFHSVVSKDRTVFGIGQEVLNLAPALKAPLASCLPTQSPWEEGDVPIRVPCLASSSPFSGYLGFRNLLLSGPDPVSRM